MIIDQRDLILDKLKQLTELKTIKSLDPNLFDESGRLTGIPHYPAAILIFNGMDKTYQSSNSNIYPTDWEVWIAHLYLRGKEKESEDELFTLLHQVEQKLEEIDTLQVLGIRRLNVKADIIIYTLKFRITEA